MKSTTCVNAKQRKKGGKVKGRKRGGKKVKTKSRLLYDVTVKPKNYAEILLSVHAQTLAANILHLNQKAVKCMTCKRIFASSIIIARQ